MNEVLRAFIDKFMVVYFDDILNCSMSHAEHMDHLHAVFDALRAAHLFANLRSTPFAPIELVFLAMLLLHMELRWMKRKLKPSRAGRTY
jgi:hypothetical protein